MGNSSADDQPTRNHDRSIKIGSDVRESIVSSGDQRIENRGSGNIFIQNEGDNPHIVVDGKPHLALVSAQVRIDQAPLKSEIDLLNPYRRSIELVGRDKDLEDLRQWLKSDQRISVRTLMGRAGAGKTRLALELLTGLAALESAGWLAGFLTGRELYRFAAQQNLSTWGWQRPTLVVADYAAACIQPLKTWLRELVDNPGRENCVPLRLLLLEREADVEEGWLHSLLDATWSGAAVAELFDPLEPIRLEKLESSANRRRVLSAMLEVAAQQTNVAPPPLPKVGQDPWFDQRLESSVWEDPLYLMMAALVSLQDGVSPALSLSRTDLAFRLAERELGRLEKFAPESAHETSHKLLKHLAAYATLHSGLTGEQALAVSKAESEILALEFPGGAGALAHTLHEALPDVDQGVAAVTPDIIGEALVLTVLAGLSQEAQSALIRRACQTHAQTVPATVIRVAQDFCPVGRQEPLEWLATMIEAGVAEDLQLLSTIDGVMPHQTLSLREKAAEVCQLLLERVRSATTRSDDDSARNEVARLSSNLAVRLSALGRREEALAQAEETVRIYQQLAQSRPDAFLPVLARSLAVAARCLSDVGRQEKAVGLAEQAVSTLRPHFEQAPTAFAGLMVWAAKSYLEICQKADTEPNAETLQPVLELLAQLKQDESEDSHDD